MKTFLSLLAVAAAAGVFALDIQKFVSDAARSGADKAVIPEGVYRIKAPDQAADHLIFRNLNDFVIDCSGSTFIFESDFKTGLAFQGCRNLTFRNTRQSDTAGRAGQHRQGFRRLPADRRKTARRVLHRNRPGLCAQCPQRLRSGGTPHEKEP